MCVRVAVNAHIIYDIEEVMECKIKKLPPPAVVEGESRQSAMRQIGLTYVFDCDHAIDVPKCDKCTVVCVCVGEDFRTGLAVSDSVAVCSDIRGGTRARRLCE